MIATIAPSASPFVENSFLYFTVHPLEIAWGTREQYKAGELSLPGSPMPLAKGDLGKKCGKRLHGCSSLFSLLVPSVFNFAFFFFLLQLLCTTAKHLRVGI